MYKVSDRLKLEILKIIFSYLNEAIQSKKNVNVKILTSANKKCLITLFNYWTKNLLVAAQSV